MKIVKKIFSGLLDRRKKQIEQAAAGVAAAGIDKIKRQCGYTYGPGNNYFLGAASGGAKWQGGLAASGMPIQLDHALLRANARQAWHGSVQARSIVERFGDSVVDVGLRLESTPQADRLGITEEQAEQWASDVERAFDAWASDKRQHRAEQITWYQSHRSNVIFQQRDGEVFQRLYYSADQGLQNPLQFSFIDPNQIYGDALTSTYGYNLSNDGIKRDNRGREKLYTLWIIDNSTTGSYKKVEVPVYGKISKKRFLLHAYAAEYAGQGRGFSRLAHALQEFENITDFSAAQIKKAINQSHLVMYVKPSKDQPASNPWQDGLDSTAGPAAEQFGANPAPGPTAQNVTDESTVPVSCYKLPEATFGVPGSTVVANLEEGEEIKPGPGNAPTESYNTFVDSFTAYLAASLSIPIEVVLMRFSNNYSASRASLILFWRITRIWQAEMAADLLNPTYEAWLEGEIAAGRITAPGWSDPRMRAAWVSCNWVGAPMPNIDPKRTADADKSYVEMGAQTLDKVSRDLNGSDGRTNRAKLRRELGELTSPPWM